MRCDIYCLDHDEFLHLTVLLADLTCVMKINFVIFRRLVFLFVPVVVILGATGCATVPYKAGPAYVSDKEFHMPAGESQIERGKPHKVVDAVDWIWPESLLGKLILWNWKVDRHHISPETEAAIVAYLEMNEMPDVKVRLNQYDPMGEWRRLSKNTSVGVLWRYSFGLLATGAYTLLPGRILGGDNYNPYTNTINLYSDIPAIALHEGGHAKDSANKKYRGTYAAVYAIPGVPLWHEAQATGDAIGYLKEQENTAGEKEAYNILYPAYGTYVGGTPARFVTYPWNYVFQLGAVIPGHVIGRIRSSEVEP